MAIAGNIRSVEKALKEFNRFFSPEATAELLKFDENKSILRVKFSGSLCRSCGYYDYFDDLKYILSSYGINAVVEGIRENYGSAIVSYVIKRERYELPEEIKKLKKSNVKKIVEKRIKEFDELGRKAIAEIFKELCFCILTANFSAEKSIEIQKKIGDGFLNMSRERLERELSRLKHRYPRKRAEYIFEARRKIRELEKALKELKGNKLRDFIVKNFRGIGYKEASHFLRNIGYREYAIIDFHIIDLLFKYSYIDEGEYWKIKNKSMTRRRYMEIEKILKGIAREINMNLGELDLYLWYMETGKVLK